MSQLRKRLISSAILVSITLTTIFLLPQWIFFILVQAIILIALHEFYKVVSGRGILIQKELGLFFGFLVPFAVYFGFSSFVLMFAVLSIFVSYFKRTHMKDALSGTAITTFGIFYVVWFCSYINLMRGLPQGPSWVFYTVLLVKGGDAGAYFIGKNYGRTKLIEHISPNKSVEGAVGGLITTLVLSFVSSLYLSGVSAFHLFALGILTSLLSQLGDLAESLIKRNVGVKDSGELPGLGGLLDVLDSLIVAIPFVYFYVTQILGAPA